MDGSSIPCIMLYETNELKKHQMHHPSLEKRCIVSLVFLVTSMFHSLKGLEFGVDDLLVIYSVCHGCLDLCDYLLIQEANRVLNIFDEGSIKADVTLCPLL